MRIMADLTQDRIGGIAIGTAMIGKPILSAKEKPGHSGLFV
jgi:hypothetical protein